MSTLFRKIRLPACCVMFSILAHILFMSTLAMFGHYDFTVPVNQPQVVAVEVIQPGKSGSVTEKPARQEVKVTDNTRNAGIVPGKPVPVPEMHDGPTAASPEQIHAKPEPVDIQDAATEENAISRQGSRTFTTDSIDEPRQSVTAANRLPMLKSVDFLSSNYEKLTYQISMFGVPAGSAELESKYENGEAFITLRVKSNAAISSIFPVDNLVETRHVSNRFIMAKIRQQEGAFRSEQLLTINPAKKRVAWTDLINGRSLQTIVPSEDVLDTLSGLYYLRNRQLQVGKTEILHIFDSETFAEVPVEILRREEIRLLNLTKVTTLVVRPLQKTAGIFRRTGDILIWMTDDDHKVPVRIITTVALGTVTAELLSAESGQQPAPP